MDNKKKKELGFSINEVDESTILFEGVVQKKLSKRNIIKVERQFSKIEMHLFDKEYIEHIQQISIEISENSERKSTHHSLKKCLMEMAKFLMK